MSAESTRMKRFDDFWRRWEEWWADQTFLFKLGVYIIAYSLVYAVFILMGWIES